LARLREGEFDGHFGSIKKCILGQNICQYPAFGWI